MTDRYSLRDLNVQGILEQLRAVFSRNSTGTNFLSAVQEIWRVAGVSPGHPVGQVFTSKLAKQFSVYSAERYLRRLEKIGVYQETMFGAFICFLLVSELDAFGKTAFGDLKERKRKSKEMLEVAAVVDGMAGNSADAPELLKEIARRSTLPVPIQTADALHVYAKSLFIREDMLRALAAHSGLEIAKYTVARAIHLITGKYHDCEVSAVLGVFLKRPDYDETAQRMWRRRNFPRLNRTLSFLPMVLQALNSALQDADPKLKERANP